MEKEFMLTTVDNPYNPYDDITSWFMFDVEKGYYSCSLLARVAQFEDNMSSTEVDEEISRAIEEIIFYDETGLYTKAYKED
jgi:hypothetical protein